MIKLVDQLSAMGSFPIATAQDIVCSDNERLQEKIDNGTLGGGGGTNIQTLTEEEYQNLTDQEKLEGDFHCYDTGNLYYKGVSYGRQTDISGKQDDLHKVKFTMRRNSVNEPRYCLIGSSDLTKTLLMNEPYRFDGTFGSNNNIEKSITSFTVSFKEGVGDPSRILRGFTNNAEGFKYVDLLITVDETENLAYAYVDFLQENSLASGEITKPFLDAESYMDFAESFELVDTYKGTLVCKMSDYCKVITEISDEVSDSTVWSSQKTSDEIAEKVDKTDITTAIDSTSTDTQVPSAKAVVDELNTKANDSEVVKKTDITDTIDINSSDIKIPTVKAIYDDIIIGKDISQTAIDTYGTEILKYPLGIWRFGTVGTANKFSDLPVKTGGRIEITSIKANTNSNPWNSSWAYRVYNFETFTGMNYFRKVTSTDKAGVGSDTGWQKVCTTIVEDVPETTVDLTGTDIRGSIKYMVKSGICYVSAWGVESDTVKAAHILVKADVMPKPVISCGTVLVHGDSGRNGKLVGQLYIDHKKALTLHIYPDSVGNVGFGSFSYPVAES